VVGLTNTRPTNPLLWGYTLCGQYPGSVPDGQTVTVHCTHAFERRMFHRYVIVQFPLVNQSMSLCEVEVYAIGICSEY